MSIWRVAAAAVSPRFRLEPISEPASPQKIPQNQKPGDLNMDQNLSPDAVTLTKTLCGRLAAARFGDLSAAAMH
jgi:hypothetical protein